MLRASYGQPAFCPTSVGQLTLRGPVPPPQVAYSTRGGGNELNTSALAIFGRKYKSAPGKVDQMVR